MGLLKIPWPYVVFGRNKTPTVTTNIFYWHDYFGIEGERKDYMIFEILM
jgi:hypothetical protein